MFPKISIVTPSFNQSSFIEETILSILDQKYPNLEYVIVDGDSTDGTVDIIKKYESHLTWWISEKDKGMYDALQKGFAKTTGEIMMWLNSDDLLHKGALRNIAEIFNQFPDVSWVTGINTRFDERSRVIGANEAKRFSKYDFCLYEYQWIQQESTAWRRSLWNQAGGHINSTARLAGDLELWSRLIQHGALYPCDILIGGFRFRSDNQLSVTHAAQYHIEARRFLRNMKRGLSFGDRCNIFALRLIHVVKTVLKYSIVLDWRIFSVILRKISERIHKYPKRISVNRRNFLFEFRN